MIPKSGHRFSEKIMLKQKARAQLGSTKNDSALALPEKENYRRHEGLHRDHHRNAGGPAAHVPGQSGQDRTDAAADVVGGGVESDRRGAAVFGGERHLSGR